MGLMDITIDITSLRTHGSTLYMSGTKVAKVLFVGVDSAASDTKIGLIDGDPYTMKLMLTENGGAIGTLVGTTQTDNGELAQNIGLYLSINCGMRLYTSPEDDEMINVTYIEVTS